MLIRILMLVLLVTPALFGGIKTGQLLGMAGTDIAEGIYEIKTDTSEIILLLPFDFNPSEGALAVAADGTLYAAFSGAFDQLVEIDLSTSTLTFIGEFGLSDISGMSFSATGELFGHDADTEQLVTIDVDTGAATEIGPSGLLNGSGLSFSSDNVLFGVGSTAFSKALYTFDTDSGHALFVGPLVEEGARQGDIISANGISFVGNSLYMSATWQFREVVQVSLYVVNPETATATRIGPFTEDQEGSMAGMAFLPGTGDVDRDGDVDEDDFAIFEECFTGPIDDPEGEPLSPGCIFLDTDDDNDIDCDDFEDFIDAWTEDTDPPVFLECRCDGDANLDGVVDPLDSGYVLARLGCSVGSGDEDCDAADVNADGVVDPLDSGYVLARFGTCE